MNQQIKTTILNALNNHRGDDYERAARAFRNYTPTEMQAQYGQSDKTCQQLLDDYRNHVKQVETAIKFVENL